MELFSVKKRVGVKVVEAYLDVDYADACEVFVEMNDEIMHTEDEPIFVSLCSSSGVVSGIHYPKLWTRPKVGDKWKADSKVVDPNEYREKRIRTGCPCGHPWSDHDSGFCYAPDECSGDCA